MCLIGVRVWYWLPCCEFCGVCYNMVFGGFGWVVLGGWVLGGWVLVAGGWFLVGFACGWVFAWLVVVVVGLV